MVQELTPRESYFLEKMGCTYEQLDRLKEFDPTGKAWAWGLKGLREGWMSAVEASDFQDALNTFNTLRQSPKFKATHSPDLLKYNDFCALVEALKAGEELKSNRQRAREYEGATLLGSRDGWAMYRVEGVANTGVLRILSSGTSWCTAQEDQAQRYLLIGPVYNIRYQDEPVCQIDPSSTQFHDTNNKSILVGRTLMDEELGGFILEAADEFLMDFFRRSRFRTVTGLAGPGAEIFNTKTRIADFQHELSMLQGLPAYQALRYAMKYFTETSQDLDLFLGSIESLSHVLEYYSCEVRKDPWSPSIPEGRQSLNMLRKRPTTYARYLNRFFDLTSHVFPTSEEAAIWLSTNPQIRNEPLIESVRTTSIEGSRLSKEVIHYFIKHTGEHPVSHYHKLCRSQAYGDLKTIFTSKIFKDLPDLDEETLNTLAVSSIRHADYDKSSWDLLTLQVFTGTPVVLNYVLQDVKKGNHRNYTSRASDILRVGFQDHYEDVAPVILEEALRGDTFCISLSAELNQDIEKMDTLMEDFAKKSTYHYQSILCYLKRRTAANYRRDWEAKTIQNMACQHYPCFEEYCKTVDVSERAKFLVALAHGRDTSILQTLLSVKSLDELGVTLNGAATAIFGENPRMENLGKDRLVIAGVLRAKFGWEIPAPYARSIPERQVHYYYYTGQKHLLLEKLDMILGWDPIDIAKFMTHMKPVWKGTDIARRLSRYKKEIAADSPYYVREEELFWQFVNTGVATLQPDYIYGKSRYYTLLKELTPTPQARLLKDGEVVAHVAGMSLGIADANQNVFVNANNNVDMVNAQMVMHLGE